MEQYPQVVLFCVATVLKRETNLRYKQQEKGSRERSTCLTCRNLNLMSISD